MVVTGVLTDTSQDARRHHACLAFNITDVKLPLSRLNIFCCGERTGRHSTYNSDSQLSVDSYTGSEILSQGTGTALNKNSMNSDQVVALPKPYPVLKSRMCNN